MQRNPVLDVVFVRLRGHGIVEAGANDAGSDAVDADIGIRQLAGEDTGELDERSFDNTIHRRSQTTPQSRRRGDQDDRALAVLLDMRNRRAAEVENGVDMDIER